MDLQESKERGDRKTEEICRLHRGKLNSIKSGRYDRKVVFKDYELKNCVLRSCECWPMEQ